MRLHHATASCRRPRPSSTTSPTSARPQRSVRSGKSRVGAFRGARSRADGKTSPSSAASFGRMRRAEARQRSPFSLHQFSRSHSSRARPERVYPPSSTARRSHAVRMETVKLHAWKLVTQIRRVNSEIVKGAGRPSAPLAGTRKRVTSSSVGRRTHGSPTCRVNNNRFLCAVERRFRGCGSHPTTVVPVSQGGRRCRLKHSGRRAAKAAQRTCGPERAVNQASKRVMWKLTLRKPGESRRRSGRERQEHRQFPPGRRHA